MFKAIKKPIEVEVMQFTGTQDNFRDLYNWTNGHVSASYKYVIKGPKEDVWPVRKDIFEETYERV